jgi:hypothetical protein
MGLNLKDFLVEIQGISTVSNGSGLILFIRGVHENLLTVQEHDFGDIRISEDTTWG